MKFKRYTRKKIFINSVNLLLFSVCVFQWNLLQKASAQKSGTKHGQWPGPSRVKVKTEPYWIQASLDTHNYFRSLHGSPPLVLNNTLSEISQHYANYLLNTNLAVWEKKDGVSFFEHNPDAGKARIGENLYYSVMTTVLDPIPASYAVLLWYEELKDYDFSTAERKLTSDPKSQIGHLTQLVWKGTTQMGTAYASRKLPNKQTIVFVVANYFQQGNVVLRGNGVNPKKFYLENVLPPIHSEADINSKIVSWNVKSWWKEQEPQVRTPDLWRDSALAIHNQYRKSHGAQPLRLNAGLCKVSQLWANYLLDKGLSQLKFNGGLYLEPNFKAKLCNFGTTSTYFLTADENVSSKQVIKSFYTQKTNFSFDQGQPIRNAKTDDFERIVWNSTTEFCMSYAIKKTDNGQYLSIVTANYYPSLIYEKKDILRNIFPVNDDPEESSGTSTVLVVFICIFIFILASGGSVFIIYKYKVSWYERILKTVRRKT